MPAIIPPILVVPAEQRFDIGDDASADSFQALCNGANHLAGYRWRHAASQSWEPRADNLQGSTYIADGPPTPGGMAAHTAFMPVRLSPSARYLYVAYDYQASDAGTSHPESLHVRVLDSAGVVVDDGYVLTSVLQTLPTLSRKPNHTRWYPILEASSGTDRPEAARASGSPDATPSMLVVGSEAGGLVLVEFMMTAVRLLNAHVWEALEEVI